MSNASALNTTISTLREEHVGQQLRKHDLDPNPFTQFEQWLEQALSANLVQPHAMTLATATADGIPSARVVLLRNFNEQGFVFYTNYNSQKSQELTENPRAALVFYWDKLARQVRIRGRVSKVSKEESNQYFQSRPTLSRLGAWASRQSQPLNNRTKLENKFKELEAKYQGQPIPRPPFWGGFRLAPSTFEFWQGRPNRLHYRFKYSRQSNNWIVGRLSP